MEAIWRRGQPRELLQHALARRCLGRFSAGELPDAWLCGRRGLAWTLRNRRAFSWEVPCVLLTLRWVRATCRDASNDLFGFSIAVANGQKHALGLIEANAMLCRPLQRSSQAHSPRHATLWGPRIHSRQYSGLSMLCAHETRPEIVPSVSGASGRTIQASRGTTGYGGTRPNGIAGTNPYLV